MHTFRKINPLNFSYFYILLLLCTLFFINNGLAESVAPNKNSSTLNNEANTATESQLIPLIHTQLDAQPSNAFLVLSNLYFNPFASCIKHPQPCPLIAQLARADIRNWPTIFKQYDATLPQYFNNTNYSLLFSLQQQLQNQSVKPKFVLLLGDNLAPDFLKNYTTYSDDPKQNFIKFALKTQQFIIMTLANAVGQNIPIYPVLGETDSLNLNGHAHYNDIPPDRNYLQKLAAIWQPFLKISSDANTNQNWIQPFTNAGYYTQLSNNPKEPNLIFLNSVIFSSTKNHKTNHIAKQQLTWLTEQLQAIQNKHQKAWIIMNLPLGIDAEAVKNSFMRTTSTFWQDKYAQSFFQILQQYPNVVTAILSGNNRDNAVIIHLQHPNDLPDPKDKNVVLETGTPSITPGTGSNPAYKIFFYNNDLFLNNDIVYYLPLDKAQSGWSEEYNYNIDYRNKCPNCPLVDGFKKITLRENCPATQHYLQYYSVSSPYAPTSKPQFELQYFWCSLNEITTNNYEKCIYERLSPAHNI